MTIHMLFIPQLLKELSLTTQFITCAKKKKSFIPLKMKREETFLEYKPTRLSLDSDSKSN